MHFQELKFDLDWPSSPDVRAVVPDGAIRGELAHSRHIQDRHTIPSIAVAIRDADSILALDVGAVISKQQVLVRVQERVVQGAEQIS
jgi:hypothetical protein